MLAKKKKRIAQNGAEQRRKRNFNPKFIEAFKSFVLTTFLNLMFGSVLAAIVMLVIDFGG